MKYFWLLPVLAVGLAFPSLAKAQEKKARLSPRTTEEALNTLIKSNNAPVQCGSTKMTVGELLSMHLSYFDKGENRIVGLCVSKQCELALVRANGKDAYSLTLKFSIRGDAADPATIRCSGAPRHS